MECKSGRELVNDFNLHILICTGFSFPQIEIIVVTIYFGSKVPDVQIRNEAVYMG